MPTALAYAAGGLWLVLRMRHRVGSVLGLGLLRPLVLSIGLAVVAWGVMEAWAPERRLGVLVALAVIGLAGAVLYGAGLRAMGALPGPGPSVQPSVGVR